MLPEILSFFTQRRPGSEFCAGAAPCSDVGAVNRSLRKGPLFDKRTAWACLAPINWGTRPGVVREGTPQRGHRSRRREGPDGRCRRRAILLKCARTERLRRVVGASGSMCRAFGKKAWVHEVLPVPAVRVERNDRRQRSKRNANSILRPKMAARMPFCQPLGPLEA
jgi:hypothetical protein